MAGWCRCAILPKWPVATKTRPPRCSATTASLPSVSPWEWSRNILEVGKDIEAAMRRVEKDLPLGIDPHRVANQPEVVQESVGHFTRALTEAVVIVLLVSFASLGLRAGVVVAVCIPLVLAITFVAMGIEGISLQRISLGALVIALGLLVDDAMIAVEMMIRKLEEGF